MDNRFLQCVAEHRAEQRLRSPVSPASHVIPVSPTKDDRFRCLVEDSPLYTKPQRDARGFDEFDRFATPAPPTPPTLPTPPTPPKETTVYYSTGTKPKKDPVAAFEKEFTRASFQSPLLTPLTPRKRQDSVAISEESFPSLPSRSPAPSTPIQKAMGWSDALRKNMETDILRKQKPRVGYVGLCEDEAELESEEIQYDEDGFPFLGTLPSNRL